MRHIKKDLVIFTDGKVIPIPSGSTLHSQTATCVHDHTVLAGSAEWLALWFSPLLNGAEDSPHRTPVGLPPVGGRVHG